MTKTSKKTNSTTSVIPLEQELPEVRNRKDWEIPTVYLEKDGKGGYKEVKGRRPSKTLLVNSIRAEVDAWRNSDYSFPKGVSSTSLRLLEFWFGQDHLNNGALFHFRFAQREAIETTIYLYEIKGVRDNALLTENYMDKLAYGSDLFTQRKEIIETAREKRILTRIVPERLLSLSSCCAKGGMSRTSVSSSVCAPLPQKRTSSRNRRSVVVCASCAVLGLTIPRCWKSSVRISLRSLSASWKKKGLVLE